MHCETLLKKILRLPLMVLYVLIWLLLYQWGDKAATLFFYIHHNENLDLTLAAVSDLFGKGLFYIVFFAILWVGSKIFRGFASESRWFKTMVLWLSFTFLVTSFLKVLFGQARPMLWIHDNIYGFFGPSFSYDYWALPSGHTTTCVSLALGLSMRWPKHTIPLLCFALIFSLLRVVILQHYISNILMTTILVMIEWVLFMRVRERLDK